jgi:hypothetical protein
VVLARGSDIGFVVNDRIDVALAAGADGSAPTMRWPRLVPAPMA